MGDSTEDRTSVARREDQEGTLCRSLSRRYAKSLRSRCAKQRIDSPTKSVELVNAFSLRSVRKATEHVCPTHPNEAVEPSLDCTPDLSYAWDRPQHRGGLEVLMLHSEVYPMLGRPFRVSIPGDPSRVVMRLSHSANRSKEGFNKPIRHVY